MNRMAKRIFGKGGWSILLILMVGFIFSPLAQAQSADSPMLRLGYKHADLQTLDPHRAAGSQDRVLVAMIFNGLLRYQSGNQSVDTIEPDLAKNIPVPQILPDGRQQWVFHLRQGVMSHPYEGKPGYEITSEDVVYSLGRAADQKRSTYSGDFAGMTFEATNKYAVSVIVAKPISPHLFLPKFANMSGGLIVCKKPVEEKGDKWCKTNPVGTGPFMFKSYHPMQKVVLVRNPQYFLGPSKLAAIEFFYMPNVSSREMALQKGEVDVIEGPREQSWLKKVEKIPGVIVDATKGSENIVAIS
ncbi:MAG: ABC transporter substrate-binding protein, partial [Deltaproteobacteria bacterium]|nr:ABC transporter substrate-binding protein [Deltaproteobacteria bacterium]